MVPSNCNKIVTPRSVVMSVWLACPNKLSRPAAIPVTEESRIIRSRDETEELCDGTDGVRGIRVSAVPTTGAIERGGRMVSGEQRTPIVKIRPLAMGNRPETPRRACRAWPVQTNRSNNFRS